MKKTFKFFLMAAIVAAGFTACSSEEVTPPDPDKGNGIETKGESTYATFSFNIDATGTKANAPAGSMLEGQVGDNSDYLVKTLRLLVFNANNQLEVNEIVNITGSTYQSKTVKLFSGTKKILVLANEHSETSTILNGSTIISLDPDDTSITNPTTYVDFKAAVNLFHVGGWNGVAPTDSNDFVGGSTTPLFNINRVTGTAEGGDYPFIMSNPDDGKTYVLKANVTEDESKQTPASEEKNHFTIDVKRAVAKGVVAYDNTNANIFTTIDGLGTLASLKYGIDNVNRSVYLFQQGGTAVQSPYYNEAYFSLNQRALYYPYFYKMYDLNKTLQPASTASTAVYFTENTHAMSVRGNRTYAAIEAVFTPVAGKWGSAISWENSLKQVTVTAGSAYSATDLYMVLATNDKLSYSASSAKFDEVIFYPSLELANKALYVMLYGTLLGHNSPVYTYDADLPAPGADWSSSWTPPAKFTDLVVKYTDRKCFYRMDMGSGVLGSTFDYRILRNTQYFATITGFKTIGENDRRKLDKDPDEGEGVTFVTATIKVLNWDEKAASGEV